MTLERLQRYGEIHQEVQDLRERIEELRMRAEGVGAINTEKPVVQGSGTNATEEARVKLIHVSSLYVEKAAKLLEEQMAIENAIDQLDSQDRYLLRLRYIDGERTEEIAARMHYSQRQIERKLALAVVKLRGK